MQKLEVKDQMLSSPQKFYEDEQEQSMTQKKMPEQLEEVEETPKKQYEYEEYISPTSQQNQQTLKAQVQCCLNQSQYSEASFQIKRISNLKKSKKKNRMRAMSAEHLYEKQSIKNSHKQQVKGFKARWQQNCQKLRIYEEEKLEEFKMANKRDQSYFQFQISRKCRSVKPTLKLSKLRSLQKYEKYLRKKGETTQLRKIRSSKHKLRKQCHEQLQGLYNQIIVQEEKKYKDRQTKRYNAFMEKMSNKKNDNERIRKIELNRLRQKYKNLSMNLQHEQIIEMKSLLRQFNY